MSEARTAQASSLRVMEGSKPKVGLRPGGSCCYRVLEGQRVEVYDLDFAAYCLMRDMAIVDMIETRSGGPGRPPNFLFLFHDPEQRIGKLSVDYTNSESARHADCVRRIKKAIRSTKPREG